MEEKEIKVRPFFAKCIIVESITVVLILLSVLCIKFADKKLFSELEKWYEKNILDDTTISEVTQKDKEYEI